MRWEGLGGVTFREVKQCRRMIAMLSDVPTTRKLPSYKVIPRCIATANPAARKE